MTRKSVLSPAMIVHPRQRAIAEWRDELVPLVTSARDALHRLSGVWLEVESIPRVISVDYPTPATFKAEWKRIHRMMRGEEHTLLVAFSIGVGSRDEDFGGWGGGRGGSAEAVIQTAALGSWRRNRVRSDPATRDSATRQEWLVVHEMCHMLELPHACKDPRAEECAANVMGYTSAAYSDWKIDAPGEYGFNDEQIAHLRGLDYVEVREDTEMPDEAEFRIIVADGTDPLYPAPRPETRRDRPTGARDIRQIQIHSTRGNAPTDMQVSATVNHFASEANLRHPPWHRQAGGWRGWGGSADFVVGRDGRLDDAPIVIVQFGDWENTWSRFSAGYGAHGWRTEYPAAEVGVAIEIAQRNPDDDIEVEVIRAVAWLCRHIDSRLMELGEVGILTERIEFWDQARDAPVPFGYIGHEDLANGIRLGKSDPGPAFPWPVFLALAGGADTAQAANEGLRALATTGMLEEIATELAALVGKIAEMHAAGDRAIAHVETIEPLMEELFRVNSEGV